MVIVKAVIGSIFSLIKNIFLVDKVLGN